jgi:hypothetical protein
MFSIIKYVHNQQENHLGVISFRKKFDATGQNQQLAFLGLITKLKKKHHVRHIKYILS